MSHDHDTLEVISRGRELEEMGQREQAILCFRDWLLQYPNTSNSHLCWYEYGRLLYLQGHHETAENAFCSALEIRSNFIEATLALGRSLETQGKVAEAIKIWEESVSSKPLQIELLNNIARVSEQIHQTEKAEVALINSLQLDNTQSAVLTTLLQQRQKLCRWPVLSDSLGVSVELQKQHIGPLMSLALFDDPIANRAAVQRFIEGKKYYQERNQPTRTQAGQVYAHHDRLRLGFLSADFRLHATSVFFSPLIEHLDRTCFEVVLLDITVGPDPFPFARQQLFEMADKVIALQHLSDDEAAQAIQALEIDVLIDMAGLTAGARPGITVQRPAPVQMSYIGFLASSGIPNVDYLLTAEDLFPYEHAHAFSEKPLVIEGLYLSFTNDPHVDTGTRRADCGLDEDSFVYCALLNSYKITPEMFDAWMAILRAVPDSVLWLVEENATMRANLEQEAKGHSVDPSRLRFSSRVHPAEYRTRLSLADVFLDSSPYGNGATTRDVLLANVPIITKPGQTMMSRLTAHMISSVGCEELVMNDINSYVQKAISLGRDRSLVAQFKQRLIDSRLTSPLFDTRSFAQRFGNAVLQGVTQMRANALAKSTTKEVLVHQIFYNEETRQKVLPGFIPIDNTANLRPDWFEFWVMLGYLRETSLREDTWYGFLSPRFSDKTGLSAQQVLQTIEQASDNTDVFLFTSAWDQSCYFLNPWEQGEVWHPSITALTQAFLDHIQMPVCIKDLVTDSSCTVLSNYFVGNKKFWTDWHTLAEQFFEFVENNQSHGSALLGDTSYGSVTNRYPMKTFIQERFATLLLATGDYKIVHADQSSVAPIFQRFFSDTSQTRRALQTCDWLKNAYRQTGDENYLQTYWKARQGISFKLPTG